VPVLLYHGLTVSSDRKVGSREKKYWVSEARFRGHLNQIHRGGYRVLLLRQLWNNLAASGEEGNPVALSFDDGRVSDYSIAFPALLEASAGADFFVNTGHIGKQGFLSWQQIAEMQRAGMAFQSHGHEHVDLSRLSEKQLSRQLELPKRLLEDRLGAPVDFLAVPYGLVNAGVVDMALRLGYQAVCTSWNWPARPGQKTVNRVVIYGRTSPGQFQRLLAGNVFSYSARMARTVLLSLPKRVLLRYRPDRLGVQTLECQS
jgi:peptidoglycan/xylan/chitin deacetylase (PgdA/CDA1 family)